MLEKCTKQLKENKVPEANIKAKLLLCYLLQVDKVYLTIHAMDVMQEKVVQEYEKSVQKIIQGKPIQYITKKQEFMKLNLEVNENVLIPQPDTEILAEESIKAIKASKKKRPKVLDLCTGSGAIAVAIAKYTTAEVFGTDISQEALELANKNASIHHVEVKYMLSNLFQNIADNLKFDIIVSNPPYIPSNIIQHLDKEVQCEPIIALDGGTDGLAFYKIIAQKAYQYLEEGGQLLLEIGYDQKEPVTDLFQNQKQYINIMCIKDLAGKDRVIKMRKKG